MLLQYSAYCKTFEIAIILYCDISILVSYCGASGDSHPYWPAVASHLTHRDESRVD